MRAIVFIILVLAAIMAYFKYLHKPAERAGEPAAASSSVPAPVQPAEPSTERLLIERATGKFAVDQGMKARRVVEKANSSNVRMPEF